MAELDALSYRITQDWFRLHASSSLEYRGLPLGHLLNTHLWSKVGRTFRRTENPEYFAFEAVQLLEKRDARTWGWPDFWPGFGQEPPFRLARRQLGRIGRRIAFPLARVSRHEKVIATPVSRVMSPRLLEALNRCSQVRFVPVAVGDDLRVSMAQARAGLTGKLLSFGYPPFPHRPSSKDVQDIRKAVIAGLRAEGVELIDLDADTLTGEVARELNRVDSVEYVLENHPVDAVFLQADDSAAGVAWVLAARKRGIPTIGVQHGLDCEHGFHSEAFADAFAVWGQDRLVRYRRDSVHQPDPMEVTGNPEYLSLRRPSEADFMGEYWLWVTRPHSPTKCYSPSRHPIEGVRILTALLDILHKSSHEEQRLLIKAHPADLIDAYHRCIRSAGMENRVGVVQGPLDDWLPKASFVISEDSTAGMDAMMYGKAIIHAHFAECDPVLPFVDYGAAFPGYCADTLAESLLRATSMKRNERNRMYESQTAFLNDFAGTLDGHQVERIVDLIYRVLGL